VYETVAAELRCDLGSIAHHHRLETRRRLTVKAG
jgi:hypothetical protein